MTESTLRIDKLPMASLVCGVLGFLIPVVGALGVRTLGVSDEDLGIIIGMIVAQSAGLLIALTGLTLGIVALLRFRKLGKRSQFLLSAHGAGLSLLACIYFIRLAIIAGSLPQIHNISTDIEDPPVFTTAPTLRAESSNPLAYDSERIGPLQREAYPDLKPLVMDISRSELHGRVKRALEEMGLEVTRDDPAAGELEAVDTTFWYGFKDDLVVRLREVEGGRVRMDARSVSRVGRGDLAANANRIMEVMERVQSS